MERLFEGQCDNTPSDIEQCLDQLQQARPTLEQQNTVLIMEHTGQYVKHLAKVYLAGGGR